MSARRARAGADCKRQHTENERERRHDDGPETQARRIHRRIEDAEAFTVTLRGELHDEDGVLGGEPDQRDQTDLEIDGVVYAGQPANRNAPTTTATARAIERYFNTLATK